MRPDLEVFLGDAESDLSDDPSEAGAARRMIAVIEYALALEAAGETVISATKSVDEATAYLCSSVRQWRELQS